MAGNSQQVDRQRRYRRHKSGDHSQCLPYRECRLEAARNSAAAPVELAAPKVAASSLSPRDAIERELARTIGRLDVLHEALTERPLDVELLAEARGQQRSLAGLTAALGKLGA